jgi:hypothetical protein
LRSASNCGEPNAGGGAERNCEVEIDQIRRHTSEVRATRWYARGGYPEAWALRNGPGEWQRKAIILQMFDHVIADGSASRQAASEAGMHLSFIESRVSPDLLLQRSGCCGEKEAQHLCGSPGHSTPVRFILAPAARSEAVIRERSLRAQMLIHRDDRSILSHTHSGVHAARRGRTDDVHADELAYLRLPLRAEQFGGKWRCFERGPGRVSHRCSRLGTGEYRGYTDDETSGAALSAV